MESTGDGAEPGSDAERRHMWLWGSAALLLVVAGTTVLLLSGPRVLGFGLMFLAPGLAHIASEPRRVRWRAREDERKQRRSEALG
jgi:hypothetical protein